MAYVNKMDITGANFYRVVQMMKDRLHANAVPIQIPVGAEAQFRGIIDLMLMKAYIYYDDNGKDIRIEEIPADLVEKANNYRSAMVESICETDDTLFEKYCLGEDISIDELKAALRRATIANKIVPVVCGTSYKNKGVQKLLDAIVDYMPSPIDIPSIKGVNPETGEEEYRHSSDDEPFSALAFKIMTDPFVGKLCFFRVYSGFITAGSVAYNSNKGQRERLGRILQMHSNDRTDIDVCYSGDIAAVIGTKNTTTGDTFCDEKHPIILENMEFPEPVIRVAIEPKTRAGQENGNCAFKARRGRPTFKPIPTMKPVRQSSREWESFILKLSSQTSARIIQANIGKPQVAYKETIRRKVDHECKYKRQSGGVVSTRTSKSILEPNEPGKGYEFINAVTGGAVPKEFIEPVNQGIKGAMQSGVCGLHVVDVIVTFYDGLSRSRLLGNGI